MTNSELSQVVNSLFKKTRSYSNITKKEIKQFLLNIIDEYNEYYLGKRQITPKSLEREAMSWLRFGVRK